MLYTVLYAEINFICILILLMLTLNVVQSMFLQSHRYLFLRMILLNTAFCIIDFIWVVLNNNPSEATILYNQVINICYFITSGWLAYMWFDYSETVQKSCLVENKVLHFISTIPLLTLAALSILSYWYGFIFVIDDNGAFSQGPLYKIQIITCYGYIVFTALKAYAMSFKCETYQESYDLRILALFALPTLVSAILDNFASKLPLLSVGYSLSVLCVFLSLQGKLIFVDVLTGLNNRNCLYQFLSRKLLNRSSLTNFYLIMMDVNNFKYINEKYGRTEGDKALQLVALCLKKTSVFNNFFISRYGGDEFILACDVDNLEQIDALIDNINLEILYSSKPYELSLSVGYAKLTDNVKNIQEFISVANKDLNKKRRTQHK